MPYADLNGQRIFYEDSGGDGPPIVLGHGFLMDLEMFDPQVRVLAPEFRVIRFDERGFGQTVGDGKPFTYWDYADDCVNLLDHLGIKRAVLGGMSQGGFLSLRAALRYPERVRALVLMSTAADVDDPGILETNRRLLAAWAAEGPHESLLSQVAEVLLGKGSACEPWIAKWGRMRQDALRFSGQCLLERDDLSSRLAEIRCPAIVIHGTEDIALTISRGEALSRGLPGCETFVRVEGAAHTANLTHPEAVNPPLLKFLRTHAV